MSSKTWHEVIFWVGHVRFKTDVWLSQNMFDLLGILNFDTLQAPSNKRNPSKH